MKTTIKVLASKRFDAMEGWVWICPSLINENGFYSIKNLETKNKTVCYVRAIDNNFVDEYKVGRTYQFNIEDEVLIINEYYRRKLGIKTTNNTFKLEIEKLNWIRKNMHFEIDHPNPYIRQSGKMTILSVALGILALLLSIFSLF